jgi:hypothetical protein
MRLIVLFSVCLLVPMFFAACSSEDPYDALDKGGRLPGAKSGSSEIQIPILSDAQAKAMITFKCTACHTNTSIKKAKYSKEEWTVRVQRCKEKPGGAKISPIDAASLVNWMARKYGR